MCKFILIRIHLDGGVVEQDFTAANSRCFFGIA